MIALCAQTTNRRRSRASDTLTALSLTSRLASRIRAVLRRRLPTLILGFGFPHALASCLTGQRHLLSPAAPTTHDQRPLLKNQVFGRHGRSASSASSPLTPYLSRTTSQESRFVGVSSVLTGSLSVLQGSGSERKRKACLLGQ